MCDKNKAFVIDKNNLGVQNLTFEYIFRVHNFKTECIVYSSILDVNNILLQKYTCVTIIKQRIKIKL